MANAKQCDICKAFYPAYKLSNRRATHIDYRDSSMIVLFDPLPDTTDLEQKPDDTIELETCPNCMKSIKNFIEAITVTLAT